jgi:hypothetical protein
VEVFLSVDDNPENRFRIQVGVFRDLGIENLREQIVTRITHQLANCS